MKKINFILSSFLFLWAIQVKGYIILPAPTQTEEIKISSDEVIDINNYPSIITLSNLPTKISNLTIGVLFSTGTNPTTFLDVILEGPQGQTTYLFSDVGNTVGVSNFLCFISDDAPIFFPTLPGPNVAISQFFAFFKPTDGNVLMIGPDIFPAPAPVGPYPASLAIYNDTNPNGDWKLYVTCPATLPQNSPMTIHSWQLIMNLHPLNDFTGDKVADYVLRKRKKIFVITETNTIPFSNTVAITKATVPNVLVKGKVVSSADLDGDHISDLIIQKGRTIQALKGPDFVSSTHILTVKKLKPVASGDFNGDLIPDLYFQKKTSLFVAINTGTSFQAPQAIATIPKKFKVFGALSGRSRPAVIAQSKTTIARLEGPSFSTPIILNQTLKRNVKACGVGQFIFGLDIHGSTILYRQKKTLSFTSPFVSPGTFNPLQNNERRGLKLVAPR